jgi:CheY-like chemotaxis protein
MSLIETYCPNCKKKIFLDLEEVVSESTTRPIKCSQCGKEFTFGFDAEAYPVSDGPPGADNQAPPREGNAADRGTADSSPVKTVLVKRVVLKKVLKAKPKADKKIIVIEYSAPIRQQIGDLFSDDVRQVVLAETAEEGLVELKKGRTDLLIVDMVLPDMSVRQFMSIVRKHVSTANIIIFTAGHATNLDIFDESMEGIGLVFNAGADSFDELRDKGMQILGLE